MSKNIAVLGAGMVGVSSAWHLRKKGYQVTLIDKSEPGNETSFGNAGLIQREAIKPYPFPRSWKKILKVIPNNQIDIRYQFSEVIDKSYSLYSYWKKSGNKSYLDISREYETIISKCVEAHEEMIVSSKANDIVYKSGYIEAFRNKESFEKRCQEIDEYIDGSGLEYEYLKSDDFHNIEPDLKFDMAGGIHWKQVWAAQTPGKLVERYYLNFSEMGGEFIKKPIQSLDKKDKKWRISFDKSCDYFDEVVIALGPWSTKLLKPLGVKIPLFFKKGSHINFKKESSVTLNHPILDAETGFVLVPMEDGVRVCSGADISSISSENRFDQIYSAEQKARELLDFGSSKNDTPWSGSRPCLPDMKPVIGAADGHEGLWLAFGHGHQGFTLGPITGRLISQLISGEKTDVDLTPFRANRF